MPLPEDWHQFIESLNSNVVDLVLCNAVSGVATLDFSLQAGKGGAEESM
jgi:hypothetical protein